MFASNSDLIWGRDGGEHDIFIMSDGVFAAVIDRRAEVNDDSLDRAIDATELFCSQV